MSNKELRKIFGDWYGVLRSMLISEYFNKLLTSLNSLYKTKSIWPRQKDVFRAFRLTSYKSLRIIIIAMDPYNTSNGKANGLAFSNTLNSGTLSPSLRKIREVVEDDYYKGLNLNFDQTLESWAKQGVLLINTALTVEEGKAGSHFNYWSKFTRFLLKALSEYNSGVIYVLWGKDAQGYTQFINSSTNHILVAEHPSYAARKGRKWNFSFKQIDELTEKLNGDKIKW